MARNFQGRPRKEKQWGFIPGGHLLLTGAGTSIVGALNFSSVQTVLRLIGEYVIGPTSAPAALDQADICFAIGKVSSDAFAAGAASIPDPSAEPEYPWLYWACHAFNFSGTDPEGGDSSARVRKVIDVKSMRKFRPGEALIYVVQYVNGVGFPPMSVDIPNIRCLLTIH